LLDPSDPAIKWLLDSKDPSVRYFTLTGLLDEPPDSASVLKARAQIPNGSRYRALMSGQRVRVATQESQKDRDVKFSAQAGGFGVHPYQKWTGAHWRLVSLIELGMPRGDRAGLAASEQVLRWLWGRSHRGAIKRISGRIRRCASQEGNALGVCSRLGMGRDERVRGLAHSLVDWQWPDGGWNCDKRPEAHHSSFNESLAPLWGLAEYSRATRDDSVEATIEHAAELFLRHKLFRSERTGRVMDSDFLKLHYPVYWHYDILQALRVLGNLGKLKDLRAREALDVLERKRGSDGLWRVEGCYWARRGRRASNVEVVDWGQKGPNEMITLNALRVLKTAGRIQ